MSCFLVRCDKKGWAADDDRRGLSHFSVVCSGLCAGPYADIQNLGAELEVTQTESGEHIHTFKSAQPVPVVAWAPTRFFLAYAELGTLRIVGVDTERKY